MENKWQRIEGYDEECIEDQNAKVLCIKWIHLEDTMQLVVQRVFETAHTVQPTKRNILKVIASTYDPVGFLAPIVLNLKLLFQEICLKNIGWDDPIGNLETKWRNIVKLLSGYADMKIKCCYYIKDVRDPIRNIYLHGFSDDAEKVFANCIHMKIVT